MIARAMGVSLTAYLWMRWSGRGTFLGPHLGIFKLAVAVLSSGLEVLRLAVAEGTIK